MFTAHFYQNEMPAVVSPEAVTSAKMLQNTFAAGASLQNHW